VVPWEALQLPGALDGSSGQFRAPVVGCTLTARDDYEAVTAWIGRQESAATKRAYTKEAERLILWAVVERGKPMSSLAAEDATAYRAFLRQPSPRARWVGPPRSRTSSEWRPFAGALSANSIKYTVTVLGAMYRWLVEQGYVRSNPFAGMKVRGASTSAPLDAQRVFAQGEWSLIRVVADGLEWSYGWTKEAAQRLRFLIDFCYATGLRASEFTGAVLGNIEVNGRNESWLHLVGKGAKEGKVSLPPLARAALDQYLIQRGLPVSPSKWEPSTPLLARLGEDAGLGLTPNRLWSIVHRFFVTTAGVLEEQNPIIAEKLRRASPHWMRHTHATHALERGAELTTVRDNLRHASISTTSTYLHSDDAKRDREMAVAFGPRKAG
jgi:site-specific recombinase XerD